MPRIDSQLASAHPDPRLSRILWQWLTVGVLTVALFPAARGDGLWLGWLPFWALIAPLASLLALHRQVLTEAWRAVIVPVPRRRRPRKASHQASHLSIGSLRRRKAQKAA